MIEDIGRSAASQRRACAPSGLSRDASQAEPLVPNASKRWTRAQYEKLGNDRWFLPAENCPLKLVIIESPYAGDVEANVEYARAAMRDSLNRGEVPIASHLLYTQPGILRDEVPEERQWGIDAGLAWRSVAELAAFYVDRNWSGGMLAARKLYREEGFPYEVRTLDGEVLELFPASAGEARSDATTQIGAAEGEHATANEESRDAHNQAKNPTQSGG